MAPHNNSLDGTQQDLDQYNHLQKKFRKACSQVVLLNNKIQDAQVRYDHAVKGGKKAFRYVGRLNLATLEGVRNMIYEYAARAADTLDRMQDRLVEQGLMTEAAAETETDTDIEDMDVAQSTATHKRLF